jgi:hypothetical protein
MYYEFPSTDAIDPRELALDQSKLLFQAVRHDADCKFIEARRARDNSREIIILDLQADGIPTRCRVDIDYPERMAFVVRRDPKRLVEALALRKNFPVLLHQNQTFVDNPKSLCLYYEPNENVLATWTAQRFIRRVKWWLSASATGTLHAADQPPEALFFNSRDDLVVPRDFDSLVDAGQRFNIAVSEDHLGGGNTFLLSPTEQVLPTTIEPIQITLPPVVHGNIEDTPETMGALTRILEARGVDVLALIREHVIGRLTDQGAVLPWGGEYTVIILHTPVQRTAGEPASSVQHRAYIVFKPFLEFGKQIGALMLLNGRYFRDNAILGQAPVVEGLNDLLLAQFSLLRKNGTADFRAQSGINHTGVKSVLIGAGALGSSLINLWARAGWGTWTIIDKDHIKPHNLTRHAAFDLDIGATKATVAVELARGATNDPARFVALNADATLICNADVAQVLANAELVIDASTTLTYPRRASDHPQLPRHMTVFITPSGRSSVLMAESADRSIHLRTMESQYYRAVIDNDWGKRHLTGHAGTFWSGASCRDISFRLSLAQVQVHAANLAQIVIKSANEDRAKIDIWDRDNETGAIAYHNVPVLKETLREVGDYTVHLDEGLEAELRAIRVGNLPNETGGILLGYHDLSQKRIVIVKACPAPADSVGTPTSFVRGTQGVEELLADAATRTANIVGYIGEWHSHPRGHSANASRDDVVQLVGLALAMVEDGLPALQLIVGETDINVSLAESL